MALAKTGTTPEASRGDDRRELHQIAVGSYFRIRCSGEDGQYDATWMVVAHDTTLLNNEHLPQEGSTVVFDGRVEWSIVSTHAVRVCPTREDSPALRVPWVRYMLGHRLARIRPSNEGELQLMIARELDRANVRYAREVNLSDDDRIDFVVEPGLGIEVKMKVGSTAVIRQLWRYAQSEAISELLLVTTSQTTAAGVPRDMLGKSVVVLTLSSAPFSSPLS